MFSILEGHDSFSRDPSTGLWKSTKTAEYSFAKEFSLEHPNGRPSALPFKFNVVDEVYPETLGDAYRLLKRLTTNPHVVAVRGKCVVPKKALRRRKPNFDVSVPSRIIAMDVDGITLKEDIPFWDINRLAKHVIKMLNSISEDMFPLNAGFVAHASSSAGLKPGIRMHLMLESNIPVTQGQLKFLFTTINDSSKLKYGGEIADLAYYSSVQAHYFADPIFKDGIVDPFIAENKSRLVFVRGATVNLPTNLPDFETTRGEFKEEFLSLLDQVTGITGATEKVEATISELEEADDGVYLRIIPKLYHRALEDGVDFAWLEREITPALSEYIATKDNSRTIVDYFNNGRRQALKAFVNNAKREIPESNLKGIPLKKLSADIEPHNNYLKMTKVPPEGTLTFVKASLGTGKTTAVVKWLEAGVLPGKFLAITNTRALVSSNAKKFMAGQYNQSVDMLNFKRGAEQRMSSTIHSIHKFKSFVGEIDTIFIDECDAVMNDLLFSPVVKQRRECISVLRDILISAKRVILSDGDISGETIEAYGSLIDFDKPINYYVHHRKMLTGVHAYEFPDENSIWVALQTSLELGEKCILVSDCGPDELNEKGMSLRNSTDCIVKEIHSNSTSDVDIRRILDYTSEELVAQQIDALLCSPSVTSGVDFNYFDSVFVITRTSNQAPNMRFQAIRRDRGAKNIYYFIDKSTSGFSAGSDQYNIDEGWFEFSQQLYAKRRELESKNYISTLRYYLLDQGASINIFSESWGNIDSASAEYTEERVKAIFHSTPEYSMPRHADAYEAKLLLMQYYHLEKLSDITEELVLQFITEKPDQRAAFLHKLQDIFWPSILKCNNVTLYPFIEALRNHKKDFFIRTGQSANPKYARMYLGMMGIKSDFNFDQVIDWYRTYCKIEGIPVPVQFMTKEEVAMHEETRAELGARNGSEMESAEEKES
ncbi:putative replication origin binding protein [Pectobacterium phage DU_PP_V]|uniref:Putative replication origin binding protein n=1 Tax=Pectobacterium phage DU_PP_V TaxID=2041492 RepID=A0A2D2W6Z8_9CAUD|nr:replication origin binding [Pectobacterium phage DU_PP_V]ATS94068.1 putative replication origin binding protein [Pectobacterium phage DU_PP_V]